MIPGSSGNVGQPRTRKSGGIPGRVFDVAWRRALASITSDDRGVPVRRLLLLAVCVAVATSPVVAGTAAGQFVGPRAGDSPTGSVTSVVPGDASADGLRGELVGPNAVAKANRSSAEVGEPVGFDGTDSFDEDGKITNYYWDFDGDGEKDDSGAQVTHSFDSTGEKTVTLIVQDDDGNRARDNVTVNVTSTENSPPNAVIDANKSTAEVGEAIEFDGSSSLDEDGSIQAYRWDFDGDGDVDAEGDRFVVEYNFAANYTVKLTVEDDGGKTDWETVEIEVVNDTDGDDVPDEDDDCPEKAEDYDSVQDGDGCPDETIWTQDHLTEKQKNSECLQKAIKLAQQIAMSAEAGDAWPRVNNKEANIEEELAPGQGPEINFTPLGDYGVYKGDAGGPEDQIFVAQDLFEDCDKNDQRFLRLVVTILHETAHWKDDLKKHPDLEGGLLGDTVLPRDEEGVTLEEDIFGEQYPASGNASDIDRWIDPDTWTDDDANASTPVKDGKGMVLSSDTATVDPSLDLSVRPTREEFGPGDPVRVEVKITNTGSTTIEVLSSVAVKGYPFWFVINDSDGDRVIFAGPEIKAVVEDSDFVSLAPGESHTETVNLERDPRRGTPRYEGVSDPGEYTVTAVYDGLFGIPVTRSNETTVTVGSGGVPDPDDDGLPATDVDDDGLYEDVDGDDDFDIFDVEVFFDDVTGEEETVGDLRFDFDADREVDIFDVVTLFNQV